MLELYWEDCDGDRFNIAVLNSDTFNIIHALVGIGTGICHFWTHKFSLANWDFYMDCNDIL